MKPLPTPEFPLTELTVTMMREVFQAISATALEQAHAYADIAGELAVPLETYIQTLIGFTDAEQAATARTHVAEVVLPLLSLPSAPIPNPVLFPVARIGALREHFRQVTAVAGQSQQLSLIDGVLNSVGEFTSIERADLESFAAAKLRKDAAATYNQLTTLLRAGMPNIVVTGGQICTKLTMRVSMEEQRESNSLTLLPTNRARAGLRVRVADERSITLAKSAEMVGSIRIDFRATQFPALPRSTAT